MLPSSTKEAAKAIWAANPALSAAAVQRRLDARISLATLQKIRPQPRLMCGEVDPEPTRAVLRARAAELGFVAFDGPSLPYGSFVAIAKASRRRGHAVAPGVVRHAWIYGVVAPPMELHRMGERWLVVPLDGVGQPIQCSSIAELVARMGIAAAGRGA